MITELETGVVKRVPPNKSIPFIPDVPDEWVGRTVKVVLMPMPGICHECGTKMKTYTDKNGYPYLMCGECNEILVGKEDVK